MLLTASDAHGYGKLKFSVKGLQCDTNVSFDVTFWESEAVTEPGPDYMKILTYKNSSGPVSFKVQENKYDPCCDPKNLPDQPSMECFPSGEVAQVKGFG